MATGIPLIDIPLWLLGLEIGGFQEINYFQTPAGKKDTEEFRAWVMRESREGIKQALQLCLVCGKENYTTRNHYGERVCQKCADDQAANAVTGY